MNCENIKGLDFECDLLFYSDESTLTENGIDISDLPRFWRVVWSLRPEPESFIRFEMWLPEATDIFIGLGNGGMGGGIPYGELSHYLKQGYAAATTDLGTSRGMESGIDCPAVWKDFGWRATHLMTVFAKEIFRAAYGKSPDFSYFIGGSTGGQQALSEAQRFPEDYDGIICAAPANNRIKLHTYFLWNYIKLRDKQRKPLFDESDCKRIHSLAVKFYNSKTDFVPMPLCDNHTVNKFIDFVKKENPLFSYGQIEALYQIYSGPNNTYGGIYNGIPMGSELGSCSLLDIVKSSECPHSYLFYWALGKNYDLFSFDFSHDFDTVCRKLGADLDAVDKNLNSFAKNGGKIIIISGAADAVVPYFDTFEYSKKSIVNECLRFWLVPAYSHNICGLSSDIITEESGISVFEALRKWREDGICPVGLRVRLPENSENILIDPIVF